MKISDIRQMPTAITYGFRLLVTDSSMRAGQILKKTKELLREGTPPKVVLELIDEMETEKGVSLDIKP